MYVYVIPYPLAPNLRKKRPITILISVMVLCGLKNWTTSAVGFVVTELIVCSSNTHVFKLGVVVMQ
jgi:hypothetical protein